MIDRQSLTPGVQQNASGFYYAAHGAVINRLNDRVMIGEATLSNCNSSVSGDWLGAKVGYAMRDATLAVVPWVGSDNVGAGIAITAGVRSSDFGGVSIWSGAFNDSANKSVYAYYGECHVMPTSSGGLAFAMELDPAQHKTSVAATPYNVSLVGDQCIGLWIASGADSITTGVGAVNDATCAIGIGKNPAKFRSGIVFKNDSLTGADGTTGTGTAIAMAKGHMLTWYNSSGVVCGEIRGDGTVANGAAIRFDDAGILFLNGGLVMNLPTVSSAVNWHQVLGSATGNPVEIQANGTDTNINFKITPKGTGLFQIGNSGSFAANASVATVLGSVGPSGSHTTVQKWLAIKDSGGTTGYIPVF